METFAEANSHEFNAGMNNLFDNCAKLRKNANLSLNFQKLQFKLEIQSQMSYKFANKNDSL